MKFVRWNKVRVSIDYHVDVDGHYYSAPYQLQGTQLDARVTTGPQTAAVVKAILCSRRHPQQGFRSAMGLIRLSKKCASKRLEDACALGHQGDQHPDLRTDRSE